ncbi:hypothetical protein [Streptomyces sp. NPDC021969]|uniref:hypothetical protein n=1 Tax=unclassified Streptomyces TaxID=2593676 RepID=UPI00340F120A
MLTESEVHVDEAPLRAFSHNNLSSYWSHVHRELTESPAEAAEPDAVEGCVLGVNRLHHLLATGSLTSKSGAGRYVLSVYDAAPERRADDTIAFTAMAIGAGLAHGVRRD